MAPARAAPEHSVQMKPLSCILLLVERGDRVHEGLNKALLVARHFHARLELFLCDTERYGAFRPDDAAALARTHANCVAEGRDYLQALRKTIVAPDIAIATEAVCDLSLQEGVAAKLRRTRIDLIVKAAEASRRDTRARGAAEWSAVAMCAAPLLLTRGRPWRPIPRFAAVIPPREAGERWLEPTTADMGETLAAGCGAQLDLLVTGPAPTAVAEADALLDAQRHYRTARPTSRGRMRCVRDAPADVLTEFIAAHDYDLVVLGKPPPGRQPVLSSLAGRVLGTAAGDVVLTQPAPPAADAAPSP